MTAIAPEKGFLPLPILMADGELPTGDALDTLRRAKEATGYAGRLLPSRAVQGSPGPILAVGVQPDWLVKFAYVPDLTQVGRVTEALTAILMNPDDPRIGDETWLLSKWLGVQVTRREDEVGVGN